MSESESSRPEATTPRPTGSRRPWRVSALAAFAFAGGLFATTALNADGLDLRESSVTDLDHVVRQERDQVNDLQGDLKALNAEVTRLTTSVSDTEVDRLRAEIEGLRNPAGFEEVSGPGLTVILDDAPSSEVDKVRDDPDIPLDALVIHQQDIQAVVNALWAGGAEAISIHDQRIISTTGIKCVGNTVILHGVPYSPPYDIVAIGDPVRLQASLDANEYVDGILAAVDRFKLGYDVEQSDNLEIPAFAVIPSLKFARPAAEPVSR